MKHKTIMVIGLILLLAATIVPAAFAMDDDHDGLGKVRDATEKFKNTRVAKAAGYDLVPGLDYCFDNPGVGGMGYHLINTALMDTKVDARKPEALVYESGEHGRLKLVAVEYIVPAADWDAANTQPPKLFGQTFELNTDLGVYTLHAWIWKHNKLGMFSDWNPKVSCP
jgi:hypothetical protein